ncbi:MAG: hypothetical protein IPK18_10630 [Sphingobacteriales bacterium]|jgi:hypothetical protein|nr:MAG: hypothetical protein IPK18_10630 [Sphingobacteriales bacterium]
MKKYFCIIIFNILNLQIFAEVEIKKNGLTINEFVPEGWCIYSKVVHDFNEDSLLDCALVIQDTANTNIRIKKNIESKDDTFNLNFRYLLILIKDKKSNLFILSDINKNIIPVADDTNLILDPFRKEDIKFYEGMLLIEAKYYYSPSKDNNIFFYPSYLFVFNKNRFVLKAHISHTLNLNYKSKVKTSLFLNRNNPMKVDKFLQNLDNSYNLQIFNIENYIQLNQVIKGTTFL